ncbi:putative immunoglobulin-like domain containing protein [Namao virus]|nr:putative immunoglobulin-like domain containing protein [Namao virus]
MNILSVIILLYTYNYNTVIAKISFFTVVFEVNDNAILQCSDKYFNITTVVEISWILNNNLICSNKDYIKGLNKNKCKNTKYSLDISLGSTNNYLTIYNVTKSDAQRYQCEIQSGFNIDENMITLNVTEVAPICQNSTNLIIISKTFDSNISSFVGAVLRRFDMTKIKVGFYVASTSLGKYTSYDNSNTAMYMASKNLSFMKPYDIFTNVDQSIPTICLVVVYRGGGQFKQLL